MGDIGAPMVVGAGRVGLEFFGVVSNLPEHDAPVEMEEISVQVGGQAAIATATAAALGCRTRLACKLADDFLGGFILDAFKQAGVEARGALGRDSRLSRLAMHVTSRNLARSLSFFTAGDVPPLDPSDIVPETLLEGAQALLLDGHDVAAQVVLAERARSVDVPVVLDASEVVAGITELIAVSDVLISSERLAQELAPRDNVREMLALLQGLGPRAVIVTLGQKGSVGLAGRCDRRERNICRFGSSRPAPIKAKYQPGEQVIPGGKVALKGAA
jgi:sugar/nucleoside kinase (ribokinase family)